MKRSPYPINPDFRLISGMNPPLNRTAVLAAQKAMGALWKMERSGGGVIVEKLTMKLDKGRYMEALLYSPQDCPREKSGELLPCLVYYHGGGFVFNAAPYHFQNAREYCRQARCRVLFVNYRLAPANPYPAALDDAFGSYRWAQNHCMELNIDSTRIAVGGDSAGGSLTAGVCLMAREYGGDMPCGQMLVYPAVDLRMETESVQKFTDTPMCNSRDMAKYIQFYIPQLTELTEEERVFASPAEAESLAGMPAAYVETAEYDCLHDEGVAFLKRLKEEGTFGILHETRGTIHGYDFIRKSRITGESLEKRAEFLKRIFYAEGK